MQYKCEPCGYVWARNESGKARYCQRCGSDRINKIGAGWCKTIKIGIYKNAVGARRALEAAGCRVDGWSNDPLDGIFYSQEKSEVNLIVHSVAELGFANGAILSQIYKNARKLGYHRPCPAEVGPALCEQYHDQPMNECLIVAMKPLSVKGDYLGVFGVERNKNGRCLVCFYYDDCEDIWDNKARVVFVSG